MTLGPSALAGWGVGFPVVLKFSLKGYEWTRYFGKEICVVNIIDISSTKSKSDTKWHHFVFPKLYSSSNALSSPLPPKLFSDYVRSQ